MGQQQMSRKLALGLAVIAFALPSVATADVSDTIRLQGRLSTKGGGPAPDGDYGLTVSFYSKKDDATALFSYVDAGVKVERGVFTVSIGATNKLDPKHFVTGKAGWVGLKVGSDAELPRLAIHKVPYAIAADTATSLTCTGCVKTTHVDPALLEGVAKQITAVQTGIETKLKDAETANAKALGTVSAAVATKADDKDIAKVGKSGQYKDLKGAPNAALADQACATGQVVTGVDKDGKVTCATDKTNALSALDDRYVNEKQANAISPTMIAPCAAGHVLQSDGKNMVCTSVAATQNSSENLVRNPTLLDSDANSQPDHHALKSGTSSAYYRLVQLAGSDVAAIGGFSGKYSNPSIWATDLRSSSKSVDSSIDLSVRVDERTSFGAWVTCSVWVKRPDTIGTNAVAQLECFGKKVKMSLKTGDTGWHRVVVTELVRYPMASGARRMSIYGSGFATSGDTAYLRYALPKMEYGASATAWNPAPSALPTGMIAFFPSVCPAGWAEYTALRGRVAIGNPSGGKIGQTRGSGLSNNGARIITDVPKHHHDVDPPNTTSTNNNVGHYHAVDPPNTNSAYTGNHNHTGTTGKGNKMSYRTVDNCGGTASAADHIRGWGSCGFTDRNDTNWALANHTHSFTTSTTGNHRHATDIAKFDSGTQSANHTHQTNIGKFASADAGSSTVDVTMPYVQLVACYAL